MTTSEFETSSKVLATHRYRSAVVYVRQSTPGQVEHNTESTDRQYALRERAVRLGWPRDAVRIIDADLGRSGASTAGRSGFAELTALVGLGQVGIVLALEVSRLARNNSDWYRLLDLAGMTSMLADADGIYHPGLFNDRMLLGLKGPMSGALYRYRHSTGSLDLVGGFCCWTACFLSAACRRRRSWRSGPAGVGGVAGPDRAGAGRGDRVSFAGSVGP